ncbi:MAG: hypothetical protein K0R21_2006 [Anaerocolumna sp.]|jgi:vacuolar-type H+-ATPase subunit E/Vma4|nr:hypothetical protein [Anaerocolumna sp.]
MTLDEKLDQFYTAAIDSATNQNIEIISEFKKSLQKIYDEHKENAVLKAEKSFRLESENLVREKNKTLSGETITIKRKINEKSAELTNKLFEDVAVKLYDYMKAPEYTHLLTAQIIKAKEFAKGEDMIIYINPSDENLKETLEEKTGATLTISNRDFIGGTRAVMQEKNILIDNSFITKFKEAKNEFVL